MRECKRKQGDLTEATEDIIIHQVNCKGVMGSGVAKAIRDKFPNVYNEYLVYCKTHKYILGSTQLVQIFNFDDVKAPYYCINMFSQDSFGYQRQHTDMVALRQCLCDINEKCKGRTVAFPWKVGCVRGGANWEEVLPMICELLPDVKEIVLYEL